MWLKNSSSPDGAKRRADASSEYCVKQGGQHRPERVSVDRMLSSSVRNGLSSHCESFDDLIDQAVQRKRFQGHAHPPRVISEPRRRRSRHGQHSINQAVDRNYSAPIQHLFSRPGKNEFPQRTRRDSGHSDRRLIPRSICRRPRIASIGHAGGAANEKLPRRRDDLVERSAGALRLPPVERASDCHDVAYGKICGQSFSPAFD